mmetsp:Transcript_2067/g.3742  ORF Transcript_2067/g.3742 Transcript_2067/m.3742 type:complete len:137 (-) Transcript_2067:1521-1931(-)
MIIVIDSSCSICKSQEGTRHKCTSDSSGELHVLLVVVISNNTCGGGNDVIVLLYTVRNDKTLFENGALARGRNNNDTRRRTMSTTDIVSSLEICTTPNDVTDHRSGNVAVVSSKIPKLLSRSMDNDHHIDVRLTYL